MTGMYRPRVGFQGAFISNANKLEPRPTTVGPISDGLSTTVPIDVYKDALHQRYYAHESSDPSPSFAVRPDWFSDRYLYPLLTKNEYTRLTALWYLTRGIEDDRALLASVDALVQSLHTIIGWDFAIVGLLGEATYTRLATANLPLAILPRRESTCSHTLNQPLGSVFMVSNMSADWRFQQSPHVEVGGLRSYAGTQLRWMTESGEAVALGSLCVASNTVKEPLSFEAQSLLVQYGELVMSQIVSRARQNRLKQRQEMSDMLLSLRSATQAENPQRVFVESIGKIYPKYNVTFQKDPDHQLYLESGHHILFKDVSDGLWEDTDFIVQAIMSSNHSQLRSDRVTRAIVGRCGSSDRFLVVASKEIQFVFDDFDSWFIEKCANLFSEMEQALNLRHALEAKERFLRGMTHHLRTPIHGILGATDLLTEDLDARNLLDKANEEAKSVESAVGSPSVYLATIRGSGRELMTTINNIIKLNALHNGYDETSQSNKKAFDLRDLTNDVIEHVLDVTPPSQLRNLSIKAMDNLTKERCVATTDIGCLKECIKALLINAIQAIAALSGDDEPRGGLVAMIMSAGVDGAGLQIDIIDTGVGIRQDDHQRIFEPYHKTDEHKPGAGVGLTLARELAKKMRGTVSLTSSQTGQGSTFCVRLALRIVPCRTRSERPPFMVKHLPRLFRQASGLPTSNHMFEFIVSHLFSREFDECEDDAQTVSLIVWPSFSGSNNFANQASKTSVPTIIVTYSPSWTGKNEFPVSKQLVVLVLSGALYAGKLDNLLARADELFLSMTMASTDTASDQENTVVDEKFSIQLPQRPPASTSEADGKVHLIADNDQSPLAGVGTPVEEKLARLQFSLAESAPSIDTSLPRAEHRVNPLVLLVDDNRINLRLLRMFCIKRSLSYLIAVDGDEAIKQYKLSLHSSVPGNLNGQLLSSRAAVACDPGESTVSPNLSNSVQNFTPSTGQNGNGGTNSEHKSAVKSPASLVLMDLQMPNRNGIEATREIRAFEETLSPPHRAKIIIITGQDSPKDRTDAFNAGADDFLVKPVGMPVLDRVVQKHCGTLASPDGVR